jgi:hypothetical protein
MVLLYVFFTFLSSWFVFNYHNFCWFRIISRLFLVHFLRRFSVEFGSVSFDFLVHIFCGFLHSFSLIPIKTTIVHDNDATK